MSNKPILDFNKVLLQDFLMNSDINTDPVDVSTIKTLAVQCTWNNNDLGNSTTSLEASLDGINFETISNSLITIIDADGINFYNISSVGYTYIRVAFKSAGSNSGFITIQISGKII